MLHLVVLKDGKALVNVEIDTEPHDLDLHTVTVSRRVPATPEDPHPPKHPVMRFLTATPAPLSVASEVLRSLSQSVRRMTARGDGR